MLGNAVCVHISCPRTVQQHGLASILSMGFGTAGNWRQLYQAGQESLRQKAAKLGKRLRAMTQAEVQSRQTKHVEVSVL